MQTETFRPTHRITLADGSTVDVMLADGAAYQRDEWEAMTFADYERQDDGSWTFQGNAFTGSVVAL